jgi:hypothetical protein
VCEIVSGPHAQENRTQPNHSAVIGNQIGNNRCRRAVYVTMRRRDQGLWLCFKLP